MLSLHHSVVSLLLLYTLTGVSCEQLSPVQTEEFSVEGRTVTLSYHLSSQVSSDSFFFWYRQHPGKPPEFLVSHTRKGQILNRRVSGLSVTADDSKTQMDLIISSAAVTDSAVYYCALRPSGSGNQLIFGGGVKLVVSAEDDYEPSYYRLDNANHTVTACLATGFSKHNATLQHRLFRSDRTTTNSSTTRAVRISDDSVFSEVVLIQSDEGDSCELDKREARVCADTLDKDVTVNTMSLTVLVLRLLFIKTVVFNVLMTLRLWISH